MEKQFLNNWTDGLNTLSDVRSLKPNSSKETVAGSPYMENVSITKNGSLVTSTGYEEVSSIAGTGGVKALLDYNKDPDNRWLIITHGMKHYSITPSSTTWSETNLGSYGTAANYVGGTVYKGTTDGTSLIRRAILGTDIDANDIQKASISAAMAGLGGAPPTSGYIMAVFMGFLFIANGKTLYYCAVEDETDFAGGGTIGFNDYVTGLVVEGERMTVFTRSYHQGINFTYDATYNISSPLKEVYERPHGAVAFKGIHKRDASSTYFAKAGFFELGSEQNYDEQGIPRSIPISEKIDPSLTAINYPYAAKACSIYDSRAKESYFSVPYGAAQYNNRTFVYNWNWGAWTMRTGLYPTDYAYFKNSTDYEDKIYLTDYFSPRLLRFNSGYSYAGSGYVRKWKSKVFTMGGDLVMKDYYYITIVGSMYTTTSFTVKITQDNTSEEFIIDGNSLVQDQSGGYLGDNWIGDQWLGGDPAPTSKFYRFKTKLLFPPTIKKGFEMQIEIYNSEAEQPWKIDGIEIAYDYMPSKRIPSKYTNNQLKP
jgi:hypothetical protein